MAETIKHLREIISAANATTGKTDTTVTDATKSLIVGYGGGANPLEYASTGVNMFYAAAIPEQAKIELKFGKEFEGDLSRCFQYTGGPEIGYDVKISSEKKSDLILTSAFANSRIRILDISETSCKMASGILQYAFADSGKLKEIKGKLDFSKIEAFIAAFRDSLALESIEIYPETIKYDFEIKAPLLTKKSVSSIILGLADLTNLEPKTITLHPDVKSKMSQEEVSTISAKNWTLA